MSIPNLKKVRKIESGDPRTMLMLVTPALLRLILVLLLTFIRVVF